MWCWNLDASGSGPDTPGTYWNVVLEISWTDHVRNEVLLRVKVRRNILHEIRKRKANWIGYILRRNCLLQRVTKGKIQGGIDVTGRQRRRRRKLLDDLKERRGYSHFKKKTLDRTIWRARLGRGFGPVVRQTAKWMNQHRHCCFFSVHLNLQQLDVCVKWMRNFKCNTAEIVLSAFTSNLTRYTTNTGTKNILFTIRGLTGFCNALCMP
jgi:hypothetical protein